MSKVYLATAYLIDKDSETSSDEIFKTRVFDTREACYEEASKLARDWLHERGYDLSKFEWVDIDTMQWAFMPIGKKKDGRIAFFQIVETTLA